MDDSLKELAGRIERGDASPEDLARFEELLESPAHEAVRDGVRALAEDTPSLEWRSRLNERLRAVAPKPARRWFLRPWAAVAAGVAGLALLLVSMPPRTAERPVDGPSLEASLISTHRETVRSTDLAGVGVTPHDLAAAHRPAPAASPYDWNELDLETL